MNNEARIYPCRNPPPSNTDQSNIGPSYDQTAAPNEGNPRSSWRDSSSIIGEKAESTTDAPENEIRKILDQTINGIIRAGSQIEAEHGEAIPQKGTRQEGTPQETSSQESQPDELPAQILPSCPPEKNTFQLLESTSFDSCCSSSRRTKHSIQKRCSTPYIKKYPKQRMTTREKNHARYHSPRDPIPSCNEKYSQIPSVLAAKAEAKYPSGQEEERPSKCDICKYRISIEGWEPLKGAIYCPKCQHYETPLLRTKTKKAENLMSSSCCLVHCWPLCFIPYLFATPPQHFLHCAECFKFLGTYDENRKCIRPNSEYLDCSQCFSAEETKRKERLAKEQTCREYLDC